MSERAEAGMEEDHTFAEEPSEYLMCPICMCVLREPHQTPCGHRYCKACIMKVVDSESNPVCPNDRTPINRGNIFPDNAVKLQINRLKVKCPNHALGCKWVGELSDEQEHWDRCQFSNALCRFCNNSMRRTEMEDHVRECPKRLVCCKFCPQQVPYCEMEYHHSQCTRYPVFCPNGCTDEGFPRNELSAHVEKDCPLTFVLCELSQLGCHEKVQRRNLQDHTAKCASQKAIVLARMVIQQQDQIENLRREVQELRETAYPCSGQFTWQVDNIREKIKMAREGVSMSSAIYSPPFFSDEGGYKLCLCIYPAGDNNQGYLSLYFVIMKGPFDDILLWPFQRRVVLSLMNKSAGTSVGHITKEIVPDSRLHYFSRPVNPRNVGYGYPKFITLGRLDSAESEFVANGAIFFRAVVYGQRDGQPGTSVFK